MAAASGPTSRAQCEVRDCGGWICSFIYFKIKIMGKSQLFQGLLMSNFVCKKIIKVDLLDVDKLYNFGLSFDF